MCLGIVGQIVAIDDAHPDLARVDVAGAVRQINVGIIAAEGLTPGDWILIHAGFAMEKIDAATAANQTAALRDYTGNPDHDDDEDARPPDPLEGAAPSAPLPRRAGGLRS